ncbi:MAG: ATP synthase F1 subunit delta [Sphingobacteriales bacterium]|nr:ATP synthase F1 subunit delta [Sphingobacteriales bacterium]
MSSKVAARYAKALLDLALEKNVVETVHQDISTLHTTISGSRELYMMLKSPIINADKKQRVLQAVFGSNISPLTLSFIDILLKKRREEDLPDIAQSFGEQYKKLYGIIDAKLITAMPVNEALLNKVKDIVRKDTGANQVHITNEVSNDLIGGFVLEYNDKRYDASISSKLKQLYRGFAVRDYIKQY